MKKYAFYSVRLPPLMFLEHHLPVDASAWDETQRRQWADLESLSALTGVPIAASDAAIESSNLRAAPNDAN